MQEFSALQTQVDQLTRDIPTGMVLEHARDAFQQVDGHLQRIGTLASVQGHKELVLRAAKQAHFLNLVDDLGPEAMTQPEARELGEQLTAFGLAAGDPELVFLGKANMLLAEASRSVDPDSRDSLIDALGQLAEHPQAADHPTVGRQIPALVELLRDVPQAEPDPQLLLIDHQIATWMAEEPTELGEEQVDRFVELIEANGEELDIDAVELLFTTATSAIDPGEDSVGPLIDRLRISNAYYRAMRFVDRTAAYRALGSAAIPLYGGDLEWLWENFGDPLAASVALGAAGRYAALNSSEWRAPMGEVKELLSGAVGGENEYIDALLHEGEFLVREGDFRAGFDSFSRAFTMAKAESLLPAQVSAGVGLVSLYFRQNMHREAADLFIGILAEHTRESLGDSATDLFALAQAEAELAQMYRLAGDHQTYGELLLRATSTMEELALPDQAQHARNR